MKYVIIVLVLLLCGCSVTNEVVSETTQMRSLKDMMNESIVNDMYERDTLGMKIYLIK